MKNLIFILLLFASSHLLYSQMDLPPSGGNPRAMVSEEVGITSITIKFLKLKNNSDILP